MFKTVLIAAFLILMTLIWINRERVYLRDPIATVYRDGVEQSGIQVFQNYSNDVLIEKDSDPDPYRILIQGWNQVPGTPPSSLHALDGLPRGQRSGRHLPA